MVKFGINNENIRYWRRLGVMALPVAMVCNVVRLIGPCLSAVFSWFGVDPNTPFELDVISVVAFVSGLFVVVISMILAFLLGWILNGFVLRFVLKWPTEKVILFLWYLETPPEWLEENMDINDKMNPDRQNTEDEI